MLIAASFVFELTTGSYNSTNETRRRRQLHLRFKLTNYATNFFPITHLEGASCSSINIFPPTCSVSAVWIISKIWTRILLWRDTTVVRRNEREILREGMVDQFFLWNHKAFVEHDARQGVYYFFFFFINKSVVGTKVKNGI